MENLEAWDKEFSFKERNPIIKVKKLNPLADFYIAGFLKVDTY